MRGTLLARKYRIGKALGKGGFGTTYRGLQVHTLQPLAIKVEHADKTAKHGAHTPLQQEQDMYALLHPCPGLPTIEWQGAVTIKGRTSRVMVMELLGNSLHALPFPLARHVMLDCARQVLALLQHCHERGVVHRDIKPDNLMCGRNDRRGQLYLVDFGLAKQVCGADGEHKPLARHKKLTGSSRYCSLFTHQGLSQSYRDDLEALVYTLLYAVKGRLPWQGLSHQENATKAEMHRTIGQAKAAQPPAELCKDEPELQWLLELAQSLTYGQLPPYPAILARFNTAVKELATH
jgi:casein kinase 1